MLRVSAACLIVGAGRRSIRLVGGPFAEKPRGVFCMPEEMVWQGQQGAASWADPGFALQMIA